MHEYTLPLTAERNVWCTGVDRDGKQVLIDIILLPKEEWTDWCIIGDRLVIGTHAHAELGSIHHTDFALTDLPNDFVTAEDLERLGVHLVKRRSVRQDVVGASMAFPANPVQG